MTTFFLWIVALLGGGSALSGAFYLIGKGVNNWIETKQKDDAHAEKVEILKEQRDSTVVDISSADGMWKRYKQKRER